MSIDEATWDVGVGEMFTSVLAVDRVNESKWSTDDPWPAVFCVAMITSPSQTVAIEKRG